MKHKFISFFLICICFNANAVIYKHYGKVQVLRSHTSYWGSDSWVQLEGVSNVEGCAEANEGKGTLTYILVPAEEDQIHSLLLSAFISGKDIQIGFETSLITRGMCTIKFATFR